MRARTEKKERVLKWNGGMREVMRMRVRKRVVSVRAWSQTDVRERSREAYNEKAWKKTRRKVMRVCRGEER